MNQCFARKGVNPKTPIQEDTVTSEKEETVTSQATETGSSKVFGRIQGLPPSAHGWTMPQLHPNYPPSRLSISNEKHHKFYSGIELNGKECAFRASGHVNMADQTLRIRG
jgi:hypothetical protein